MTKHRVALWWPVGVSALALAVTMFWLFGSRRPLGVRNEWVLTPGETAWPAGAWGLPVMVLALFGGLAALSAYDRFCRAKSDKERRASTRLTVGALTLLSFLWPWALLGPGGTQNLISSAWSDTSNEYFATAYQFENAREFSREYSVRWQKPKSTAQAHVATHPPGAVLFYYGARRSFEAMPWLQDTFAAAAQSIVKEPLPTIVAQASTARQIAARSAGVVDGSVELPPSAAPAAMWSAFLISLILALAVPAVYQVASVRGEQANSNEQSTLDAVGEARGMVAAALFVLAPSVGLFNFTLDAVIAAAAAWVLALFMKFHQTHHFAWIIAAGVLLAVSSFLSFGALTIGVLAVLVLASRVEEWRAKPVQELLIPIGVLCAGFFAGWVLLTLIFPMQPLTIFQQAMAEHRQATVAHRSAIWAIVNILMFTLFCGWPAIVASLRNTFSRHEWSLPAARLAAVTWITVILLTFSGNVRGEVERLWLFLIPPLCVGASAWWNARDKIDFPIRSVAVAVAVLLLLQAAQTLMMAATLAPLVRPL